MAPSPISLRKSTDSWCVHMLAITHYAHNTIISNTQLLTISIYFANAHYIMGQSSCACLCFDCSRSALWESMHLAFRKYSSEVTKLDYLF